MSDVWDINENTGTPSNRPEHDDERRRLAEEKAEAPSDEATDEG